MKLNRNSIHYMVLARDLLSKNKVFAEVLVSAALLMTPSSFSITGFHGEWTKAPKPSSRSTRRQRLRSRRSRGKCTSSCCPRTRGDQVRGGPVLKYSLIYFRVYIRAQSTNFPLLIAYYCTAFAVSSVVCILQYHFNVVPICVDI